MVVTRIEITLYANWVLSLKEKRAIVKSLQAKLAHKFNISIIEAFHQNEHKMIGFGIALVSVNHAEADSVINAILNHLDGVTEAEIIEVQQEQV